MATPSPLLLTPLLLLLLAPPTRAAELPPVAGVGTAPHELLLAWDFRSLFHRHKPPAEEEKRGEEATTPPPAAAPAPEKGITPSPSPTLPRPTVEPKRPTQPAPPHLPPPRAPKLPSLPQPATPPRPSPPPLPRPKVHHPRPAPTPAVRPRPAPAPATQPPPAAAPKPTPKPAPKPLPPPKPAAPALRPTPQAVAPTPSPAPVTRLQRPPRDGDELAQWIYDRDTGRDAVATIEMVLTSRSGHQRVRRFESRMVRHDGLQDSLIRFTYPTDIDGTAFLTLERRGGDAQQFLYLPALRRVRRIVAKQKGKSFVNSDLYYQDLERRRPDKDRHRLLGEATVDGRRCWILESIPKEKGSSAYGKNIAWIDQATLLPVKGESYDRKLRKIKVSRILRMEQIEGIWTSMESEVTTLKHHHTTRLRVEEIRYNVGLKASDFNKRALRR